MRTAVARSGKISGVSTSPVRLTMSPAAAIASSIDSWAVGGWAGAGCSGAEVLHPVAAPDELQRMADHLRGVGLFGHVECPAGGGAGSRHVARGERDLGGQHADAGGARAIPGHPVRGYGVQIAFGVRPSGGGDAMLPRRRGDLAKQPRLPDTRRPDHEDRATAATPGRCQSLTQSGQFGVPPDQVRTHHVAHPHSLRPGPAG
jgi:hypothetical protein